MRISRRREARIGATHGHSSVGDGQSVGAINIEPAWDYKQSALPMGQHEKLEFAMKGMSDEHGKSK